jgi:hypothetical protein
VPDYLGPLCVDPHRGYWTARPRKTIWHGQWQTFMMAEPDASSVVVSSDYFWAGNNNAGNFRVYLDGRRAGNVAPRSREVFHLTAGRHSIRVGLWWFKSRTIEFDASSTPTSHFRVNAASKTPKGYLSMVFRPLSSLSLVQDPKLEV